jgi:hypothetical protein
MGLKGFMKHLRMVLTTVTSEVLNSCAQACLSCCHEKRKATGKRKEQENKQRNPQEATLHAASCERTGKMRWDMSSYGYFQKSCINTSLLSPDRPQ